MFEVSSAIVEVRKLASVVDFGVLYYFGHLIATSDLHCFFEIVSTLIVGLGYDFEGALNVVVHKRTNL